MTCFSCGDLSFSLFKPLLTIDEGKDEQDYGNYERYRNHDIQFPLGNKFSDNIKKGKGYHQIDCPFLF